MTALETMMQYEMEQTLYQYHTANALCVLANGLASLGGKSLDYPMYTDLIGKGKKADTRTAAEIKAEIYGKFTA